MWILEIHDNSEDMKNRFTPNKWHKWSSLSASFLTGRPHLCNWATEKNKGNPTGDLTIFIVQRNIRIQCLISSSNGNPPQKKKTTTRYPLFLFIVHLSLLQKPCLPITPVEFPAAVKFSAACASKLHKNQTPASRPKRLNQIILESSPWNETENHPNLHGLGLVYIGIIQKTLMETLQRRNMILKKYVANQSRKTSAKNLHTPNRPNVFFSFIPSALPKN